MTEEKNLPERIFQGIAAAPGIALGRVFILSQREIEVSAYHIESNCIASEIERFEQAILKARTQINYLRSQVAEKLGENEAKIFDAHLLVLEDKAFIEETIEELEDTHLNIEYCVQTISNRYIEAFRQLDDEYVKERALDIRDVAKRILQNLLGVSGSNRIPLTGKRVIVAKELTPSETANLGTSNIAALLNSAGSRTSHAVIMTRSLQAPAVIRLYDIARKLKNDDYVLVDGYGGKVILNPTQETIDRYIQIEKEHQTLQKVFKSTVPFPAQTRDGVPIQLMCNVNSFKDIENALECDHGIGLLRTEAFFMNHDRFPSEEEQFEVYFSITEKLKDREVIIRTFDFGGDKPLATLHLQEKEKNPFMGLRAIRFCLKYKEIFKDQLKAILRANCYGTVKILYPMISSVNELIQANELLLEAKKELTDRGISCSPGIEVGTMIETPSAAYTTDLLSAHCSFFSIGTNDLVQYMLAVDRINEHTAHLYEPTHPAVLRMLKKVIKVAEEKKIKLCICGEMGGDPLYVPLLVGMGMRSLSVTPKAIPEIKYLIRSMSFLDAVKLAGEVMQKECPKRVCELLRKFYEEHMNEGFVS